MRLKVAALRLKYGYSWTLGSPVPSEYSFYSLFLFCAQSVQKLFLAAIVPSLLTFFG